MPINRTHRTVIAAVLTGLALAIAAPAAANADPLSGSDALQQRVDAVLAKFPGGTQIAPNEVSWDGGATILTRAGDGTGIHPDSVGSCATGDYCAYSGSGLSGSKISFSACDTTVSTAPVGSVLSVANARSSGYVQAKNSGGSVLSTIYAGGSLGFAPSSITQLTCVS